MGSGSAVAILVLAGIVAANLPWFSDRRFLLLSPSTGQGKSLVVRLLEWLLLYGAFLLTGFGLEHAVDGGWHGQGWAFYAVTACLFVVFSMPGIIWRKDLRPMVHR